MSTYPTEAASSRESGIMREYDHALNALNEATGKLVNRLEPILKPDYGRVEMTSDTPKEVTSEARAILNRVHLITDVVTSLLDRLEV